MQQGKIEFWYYTSVSAGLTLSTSSFLIISGLFEASDMLNIIIGNTLAAILCVLIAKAIGEMASIYPSSPGIRTYIKHGLGNKLSLASTYLYMVMLLLVSGAESYVFALVMQAIFPSLPTLLIVVSILAFVIAINLTGFELPRFTQMMLTFLLLTGIFVMGLYGIYTYYVLDLTTLSAPLPEVTISSISTPTILSVIGLGIFLFIGFEWVTPLGMSPSAYERKIPKAMTFAIGLNFFIYSTFILGIGLNLMPEKISSTSIPQKIFMVLLLGDYGNYIAFFLSILAILSTFNAGLMGGAKLVYALSREGHMPKFCSKISLKNSTTIGATLFLGIAALFSATVVYYFKLDLFCAIIASCIACLVYGVLLWSLPAIQLKFSTQKRVYKSNISPLMLKVMGSLLPLLGVLSLFSIPEFGSSPLIFMVLLITVIVCLAYRQNRKDQIKKEKEKLRKKLKLESIKNRNRIVADKLSV